MYAQDPWGATREGLSVALVDHVVLGLQAKGLLNCFGTITAARRLRDNYYCFRMMPDLHCLDPNINMMDLLLENVSCSNNSYTE